MKSAAAIDLCYWLVCKHILIITTVTLGWPPFTCIYAYIIYMSHPRMCLLPEVLTRAQVALGQLNVSPFCN